ncbi:AAA ATPase-like protein [Lentzea flaviverrucosa]|uniref:AAA ATPase domain-containing protein n=2 Tax=Lentzea flaviverrucosa TaxID=200379 RepID=A0A1H9SGP6_9PSEU|nr:AAA ATPase-like protein [Lentzea flaviverrucosa]SER84068.1 AAA ATPase domain-containing protein [Lentzea flaviverrucosa]
MISGEVSGLAVQVGRLQGDLHVHHHETAYKGHAMQTSRWTPDPNFTGRTHMLEQLRELLRLGQPGTSPPVVLHGMTGSGKTSIATQLGAEVSDSVTPIFVDASTRTSLLEELHRLSDEAYTTATRPNGLTAAAGPVTPQLPTSPETLLIIDGVTSAETLHGIVPRSAECRILITSTVRYLDHGYTHVELMDWTPEESAQYLSVVLPTSTEGDRTRLAAALHHHPLALTQAAHHCRLLDRPVELFLQRLTSEPVGTLELGDASGHRRTTVRSIEMNIDLAARREPVAKDLLMLLAHLGAEPLASSFLEQDFPLTYVSGYGFPRLRWPKRLNKVFSEHSRRTWRTMKAIRESLSRDRAVTALLQLSLIKISQDGYLIHPLVALITRAKVSEPLPWLQIGFGLFARHIGQVHTEVGGQQDADTCIGHLAELAATAIKHGHRGTVVLEACVHLARRLAYLGAGNESVNAERFAEHVLTTDIPKGLPPRAAATLHSRAQIALAIVVFRQGRSLEALARCDEALRISAQAHDSFHYVYALRTAGEIASVVGKHEISRRVLHAIDIQRAAPHDIDLLVTLANSSAQIHMSLNEVSEAQAAIEWACEQLTENQLPKAVHQSTLRTAAYVARTIDDSEGWLRHELALLELRRSEQANGRRPDRWFVESLYSAADAAIEANNLRLAQELVDEAVAVAKRTFGTDTESYANVLAVRGRLRLHQKRLSAALRDLTYCANFLRAMPPPANGMLTGVLVHLAIVLHAAGSKSRAIATAKEAYDIDLTQYGEDHPETLKDLDVLRYVKSTRLR